MLSTNETNQTDLPLRALARIVSAEVLTDDVLASISIDSIRLADGHWIAPVLAYRLRESGLEGRLSPEVASECRRQLCFESAFELLVAREIEHITDACAARGIPAFVMKGAALAHTHYAAPYLRPRLDTDLLVAEDDRHRAAALLVELGYQRSTAVSGIAIVQQDQFVREVAGGLPHAVDLHWKIVNRAAFFDLLRVEEIAAESVPVATLGAHARTLSPHHTLLLLVIHRVAHHEPHLDLLDLYDLFLVASALSVASWSRVVGLADARGLSELTARAVHVAFDIFSRPVPAAVAPWIAANVSKPVPEAFRPFVADGRTLARMIASDLRTGSGWRHRARILRQHALPPAAYMRERYGESRSWRLPYLYIRRVVTGLPRALRRRGEQ